MLSAGVWDGLVVATKAITYAATFGAAGGVFFLSYCHPVLADADGSAARRLIRILMLVSVLASGARILVTAGSMSGDVSGLFDGGLLRMVWQAGEGRAFSIRTAGWLLALPAMLSARRPAVPALAAAGIAATSFAWASHAHALAMHLHAAASAGPILLISLHLLGVAFWLGALGPLLLIARHDDPRRLAAPAARFGTAATAVVALLAMAGLALLFMLLGHFSALWNSSYGGYLIAKLALVACLLSFAAYNKLRLTPQLLAGDGGAVRRLRMSIRAEMILGALILMVTAALTTLTSPPALE
jgi:copper resistance protein D